MALGDLLGKVFGVSTPAAHPPTPARVVALVDAIATHEYEPRWKPDVAQAPAMEELNALDPALQLSALHEALFRLATQNFNGTAAYAMLALPVLARALGRRPLPWDEAALAAAARLLVAAYSRNRHWVPGADVIGALETFCASHPLSPALRKDVEELRAALRKTASTKPLRKLGERLDALLGAAKKPALARGEKWTDSALDAVGESATWQALFRHAASTDAARPTKKWLAEARGLVEAIGDDAFRAQVAAWFALVGPHDGRALPEQSAAVLRGLVWCCSFFEDPALASSVADLALVCFRKLPNIGPVSSRAGNACVWTLGTMPGAIAQLGRVQSRVKYAVARRLSDRALDEAAERAGMSREDLEELAVPASVPPKEEKKMLAAQRERLERLYQRERSWPFDVFRARYLDHPLVGTLARRLIWNVGDRTAIWLDGKLVDARGEAVPGGAVSLWHPLGSDVETVRAWRAFLLAHELVQPFKQAHREIYVLTDAERATGTYSNRFAAHILRQHQLAALCRERGWTYRLQGNFDSANAPTLQLRGGLQVEFYVDGVPNEETSGAGIYLHVATDQVRFNVPLRDVPPLVFSEVMRDVDLFVGVCSVGNDPNWRDVGDGRLGAYWQHYAFGELSGSAESRKATVEELLPRLRIAPVCSIEGKFLVVRGHLRTYKIHLGSGNILMSPNDQYLCIVPGGRGARAGEVRLPFEGDQTLAIILSKAFLLANDKAIKDETILRQIRR